MITKLTSSSLGLLLLLIGTIIPTKASAKADTSFFSSTSDDDKLPYTTWLTDNASSYDHSAFLPTTTNPTNGMAAHWKVIGNDFHMAFATMATGWAAFGIAEAGGMFGADVVSFSTANPTQLVDGYILDDRQVRIDDSQDWTLINAVVQDGWIIVEATRPIDTQDTQDNIIKNDKELWGAPTRVIAAWGDSESMSYHGDNRATSSVRIFADASSSNSESEALLDLFAENSDGYFDVVQDGYEIAAEETEYYYLCKTYDELKEQFGGLDEVTMVGATPIIPEETREFVHHFVVTTAPSCSNLWEMSNIFQREQIYAWAPGDMGMTLPNDVGFPLFDTESNQAILVQIHYNNPKELSGKLDSSGVRFHYTNTPRLHKAAILQLGDPMVGLYGTKINDGLTKHEFTCPGSCSSLFLDEPVTVITELLHMHQTGTRMVNEVIRDGEVFHKASVEVYDFEQQGLFRVQQDSYQLQAGDSFRTTCYYEDGTVFKEGSDDEMCIGYLMYYPAKKFSGFSFICPYPGQFPCAEEYVSTDLSDYSGLGREFGMPSKIAVSDEVLAEVPPPVTVPIDEATPAAPETETGSGDDMDETLTSKAQSSANVQYAFAFALSFVAMLITDL